MYSIQLIKLIIAQQIDIKILYSPFDLLKMNTEKQIGS